MIVYCFEHEEFVLYNDPEIGLSSLDFHCLVPGDYAFCPPPETAWTAYDYEEWLDWISESEPTDAELREIEAQEIQEDYE